MAFFGHNGVLSRFWKGFTGTYPKLFSKLSNVVDNLVDKYTGSGMTDAEKESVAAETQANNFLSEQDFQRKIDFYEMYESPQAQVRQYKSAGLNPALMYQGGASVNASGGVGAGSVSASSGSDSLAGVLSTVLGTIMQGKQLQLQADLRNRELDIAKQNADSNMISATADAKLKASQTVGQDKENTWIDELRALDANNKEWTAKRLQEEVKNAGVSRLLMNEDINLRHAQVGIAQVTEKLSQVDLKYRDRIMAAQARVTELQGALLATQNQFEASLLQSQLDIAAKQVTSLILSNGLSAKQFDYYDSDRKFSRWTSGITTGIKAIGAISQFTAAGAVAGKAAGLFGTPSMPVSSYNTSSIGDYTIPGL